MSAELDELRTLKSNAQAALDAICARETERTGISSLKIAYNQVFGYYLEVRNTQRQSAGGVDSQADPDPSRTVHH